MPKTFEPGKNADALGIDKTRKFVFLPPDNIGNYHFQKGDVLTLAEDDGSNCPFFDCAERKLKRHCTMWSWLAYADEQPEKIAVHVPTREQYDALMAAYERKGWRWNDGSKPTEWRNERNGALNCVDYKERFGQWSIDRARDARCTIITFDEAMRRLGEPKDSYWHLVDQTYASKATVVTIGSAQLSPGQIIPNQPKPTFMENIVQKIKDLALSKEDRTLRANGMEDQCGKPTQTARDMVLQEMIEERWAARRAEVAKALVEIEKEAE